MYNPIFVVRMIKIHTFTFNAFQENTYLLTNESNEGILIDCGCYDNHECYELKDFIESNNIKVTQLLNTHCHIDHVLGVEFAKRTFGVTMRTHQIESQVLKAVETYADVYGFPKFEKTSIDSFIEEGEEIVFGSHKLKTLFTPGHAPGHIVFYCEEEKFVIGGDVLFRQSIGRSDLPGGDFNTLIKSIHTQLFTLPEDVTVYPGHGDPTTIGFEKRYNPYCAIVK